MKSFILLSIICLSITRSYSQVQTTELSQYLFPEFTPGIMLMKNGIKHKVLLNYNSLTEEIIFKNRGQTLALGPTDLQQIDTIFIADRRFCTLNNAVVELIVKARYDLFAENKCTALTEGRVTAYGGTSQSGSIASYGSINSGGDVLDLDTSLDYEFEPYTEYWLRKDGNLNKFTSIRQLKKLYNDKKDLCKSYVKDNDVIIENQESILLLIEYLEGNCSD